MPQDYLCPVCQTEYFKYSDGSVFNRGLSNSYYLCTDKKLEMATCPHCDEKDVWHPDWAVISGLNHLGGGIYQ